MGENYTDICVATEQAPDCVNSPASQIEDINKLFLATCQRQGVNSAVNLRFNLRLTLTQPVINVLAHPLVLCQSEIESEIDR